ncbi:MAG: hypothetical protein CVV49_16075 [Spirochaetae bacterium HGW-Spirochaetae-5]|nr:MAG: hypothetical protein CVV49_16075 [Spirochaetae bacterium HGW-Spirochaetae-5]
MIAKRRIIFTIIFLAVLIPGNILNSNYSYSYFKRALDLSAKWAEKSANAAAIHKRLLNIMYVSPSLFENNHILAYYGHPKSKIMGIVGRHSIPDLAVMLMKEAGNYDSENSEKGIVPAFYLIYGTCQPAGEINIIDKKLVDSYIQYALAKGFLVYLDHQIGKYTISQAMDHILPFLKYPNVHLALDPEWRTIRPMREVGSITGKELNAAQQQMKEYMAANNIPGKRQLVIHQFQSKMIRDIHDVKAAYDPVILVHATSGWGSPQAKLSTHSRNSKASNIPYKGFKLWYYYSSKSGVHYDNPLMTPAQVLGLNPEPGLIIYQ